jgi:hypothetical protein
MTDTTRRDGASLWPRRAAALAIALCAFASAGLADIRQAPNSRTALDVPERFTPSSRFSGFIDDESGASFLIVEMPAVAYEEVKKLGDRADALAQKGVVDTRTAQLPGRGGDYVYIVGKQKTLAGDYGKHILIMREHDVTVMITANIPQQALITQAVTPQQVERAFATATVRAEVAKGNDLFRLSYLGPFKESISIFGSSKAYSLTGKVPEPGSDKAVADPVFVVSPSVDKAEITDIKTVAQNLFHTFAGLTGQEIRSEKPVTIGGLPGYEIIGEGQNQKAGVPSGIYIVLLSGNGGGYYMLAGSARAADMPTYLPEFQKIAGGFEARTPQ